MGVGRDKDEQLNRYRQELKDWLDERKGEVANWQLDAFLTALDGELIRERLSRMIIVLEEFDRL